MGVLLFHSVNSGLYLWDGSNGLWVDGIHTGQELGWSSMPSFLLKELELHTGFFAHTNGVLFSHFHPDHFSRIGMQTLLNHAPSTRVYGPGLVHGDFPIQQLDRDIYKISFPGIQVTAFDTIHDGPKHWATVHQSFWIDIGCKSILLPADAVLNLTLAQQIQQVYPRQPDGIFCNVYQLLSPIGRAFLRQLAPRRIFLYHLPRPEDDRYQYRSLIRRTFELMPPELPALELLPQLSWLDDRAPAWYTAS